MITLLYQVVPLAAVSLVVKPSPNVFKDKTSVFWMVKDVPARVEIVPEDGRIPSGWVLIRGSLHRFGRDFSGRLFADTGVPEAEMPSYDIPVTLKGTILELIYLPIGVRRLLLEPMTSVGYFQLSNLVVRPVGQPERVARQFRRVLPMYVKQPRERRQKLGLTVYKPFIDLQEAYRLAGRMRAYSPSPTYQTWIEQFDLLTPAERRRIHQDIRGWKKPPAFEIVVVDWHVEEDFLKRTVDSLHQQLFGRFSLTVVCGRRAVHSLDWALAHGIRVVAGERLDHWLEEWNEASSGKGRGRGSWLVMLTAGTTLSEHALYWLASEALHHREARLVYCDHDALDGGNNRCKPFFKPDWAPELLRSTNYIGHAAAIRLDVVAAAGGLALTDMGIDNHDLLLRASEPLDAKGIRHVHAPLFHEPILKGDVTEIVPCCALNPVEGQVRRLGIEAEVMPRADGHYRVRYAVPKQRPLVSIVVPTRDALEHLQPCIDSVLGKSTYDRFELIVVDNQSSDPATLAWLEALEARPRVRILRYDHPFNYSAINNLAAQEAQGDVLCLLNNDTEVITPDWMEEMLGHLAQPKVGVVGAKLYFSDGRIQHAGDTVGPGGCAHHLHSFLEGHDPGYCDRAVLAQDLSSVTGACLMTWRELFLDLGGLDPVNLPVAFNDVDYCLRVRAAGHRVVWTPFAELYHHESVSRGKDVSPEQLKRAKREVGYMRRRWRHLMHHDPFYNPNLSYVRPDFSLSNAPMVEKPWSRPKQPGRKR